MQESSALADWEFDCEFDFDLARVELLAHSQPVFTQSKGRQTIFPCVILHPTRSPYEAAWPLRVYAIQQSVAVC